MFSLEQTAIRKVGTADLRDRTPPALSGGVALVEADAVILLVNFRATALLELVLITRAGDIRGPVPSRRTSKGVRCLLWCGVVVPLGAMSESRVRTPERKYRPTFRDSFRYSWAWLSENILCGQSA